MKFEIPKTADRILSAKGSRRMKLSKFIKHEKYAQHRVIKLPLLQSNKFLQFVNYNLQSCKRYF